MLKKYLKFRNRNTVLNATHASAAAVAAILLAGTLSSCIIVVPEKKDPSITSSIKYEETTGPNGEYTTETNTTQQQITHSDTYWRARQNAGDIWDTDGMWSRGFEGFQVKAAPFNFLAKQGAVYFDGQGNAYAYGNEDFDNNNCIGVRGYIDKNTPENDFYMLVQYASGPVEGHDSLSEDMYVATYMLKYTLPDDVYKDLILLAGDIRLNLLIQQIDKEFIPEVISKSIVDYDLICSLQLFDKGQVFDEMDSYTNYIQNVDYDNMSLTVAYNPTHENGGKIYTYTYKLKEAPVWDKCVKPLSEGGFYFPMPKEERDNLTPDELMRKYSTLIGDGLASFGPGLYICWPSDQQKATAELTYDLYKVGIDSYGKKEKVDDYEAGKISYEQVNSLTRAYAQAQEK